VVISEGLWARGSLAIQRLWAKTMLLGGEPSLITGVVSKRFDFQDFGPAPEVWVPFQLDPN
jgi:predicted cupin superfamily sugar epimerase